MKRRDRLVLKYRRAIDWARTYLAAPVVVIYYYTGTETDCPDCVYDPINKESIDPSCPTCSGRGRIQTERALTVNANVSWRGITDQYNYMRLPGGNIEAGDVIVSCKLNDVLLDTGKPGGQTYFDIAHYILVNDRKCK